ncbi:hypothetical protein Dsin_023230 [Dipteronia sinensis]|uniref:Endonuclease/exonuclease/phosphatase domain-containing protein n=1 Tax=Dipteronia sinensis TaxID=43782 RepID=A0AAE0A2Z7_9ROSI|nr:hypothetical protein Dsin_023230 [Dipteronia sinensis]
MEGDFNVVLNEAERSRVCYNRSSIRSFKDFLSNAMVVDMPLQSLSFTWTNSREDAVWSRIDRFLISPSLLICFPNLKQWGLLRSISDHNPIVLGDRMDD